MPNETKNLLDGSFNVRKAVMFVVAVLIAAVLWFLPLDAYGIEGLTVIQERVIAIFALATILWITEAVPSWATSVSVIGLLLFTTSNSAFNFMRSGIDKSELLDHTSIMATFADPIIILFLEVSSLLSQQQSRVLTFCLPAPSYVLSEPRVRMCF